MNHNNKPSLHVPQACSYPLHSRVILSGLHRAAHLNGRHGTIASPLNNETQRYAVDLDISTNQGRINVKPSNLIPEPIKVTPTNDTSDTNTSTSTSTSTSNWIRAGAQNGRLEEKHGRAINHILDATKFIVGMYIINHPAIESIDSIADLRERNNEQDGKILHHLNNIVWSHWTCNGDLDVYMPKANEAISTKGIYGLLLDYVLYQIPTMIPLMMPESANSEQWKIMTHAVQSKQAVAGWSEESTQLDGYFWVVGGCDDRENSTGGGTYLIPDANHNVVYKTIGIRQDLFPLIQEKEIYQNKILSLPVRVLPWYGRLVYDGQVSIFGYARVAEEVFATQLRDRVREAERDGVVIESLRELEFI